MASSQDNTYTDENLIHWTDDAQMNFHRARSKPDYKTGYHWKSTG
jgi:hypothetical protein